MLKSSVLCSVVVLQAVACRARHNLPSLNQLSVIGVKSAQHSE